MYDFPMRHRGSMGALAALMAAPLWLAAASPSPLPEDRPLADPRDTNPPVKPATPQDYARFVASFNYKKHTATLREFRKWRGEKDVVVADLRTREEFDRGHVAGAVHLGSDITQERLAAILPSTKSRLLLYCTNSFYPTRRIALTDVALPQIAFLGHPRVWMLEAVWRDPGNKSLEIPWEGEGRPKPW